MKKEGFGLTKKNGVRYLLETLAEQCLIKSREILVLQY